MISQWIGRANLARATGSLIVLAAGVALTTGAAYVVGGVAREAVVHAQIQRLAGAAAYGFSERALQSAAPDSGADAIARRYDPFALDRDQPDRTDRVVAFLGSPQSRPNALAISQLQQRLATADLQPVVAAARPFRLRGALEESRDLECLTQAVYYEARGEGSDGEAAVAQVVLNRTRHPSFPKSICGVVFQGAGIGGCQFSFACDGSVNHHVEVGAWRRAERIAARALDGFVMAEVGNATHFHVASLSPNWGPGLLKVAQVGAHVFYRFGGHAGSGSAFSGTPLPSEPVPATATGAAQPVYASLSLAPLASSVAASVANSVAAGAEMVMAATAPRASAADAPATAKPTAAPAAAPAPVQPATGLVRVDEPVKTASAS